MLVVCHAKLTFLCDLGLHTLMVYHAKLTFLYALGLHLLVACHAKWTFLCVLGLHPLVACHAKWTLFRDLRLQKGEWHICLSPFLLFFHINNIDQIYY